MRWCKNVNISTRHVKVYWENFVALRIYKSTTTSLRRGGRKIAKYIKIIRSSPRLTNNQQTGQNIHNLIFIPQYKTKPQRKRSVNVWAKFALFKAGSLRSKALLIRDYINGRSLDVVAITETWLGVDDIIAMSELYELHIRPSTRRRHSSRWRCTDYAS